MLAGITALTCDAGTGSGWMMHHVIKGAPGSLKEPLTAISNQHVCAGPHSLHGKMPPSLHLLLPNRCVTTMGAHSQLDGWEPHTSGLKNRYLERTAETCLTVAQMCSWSEPSSQRGFFDARVSRRFLRHRLNRSIRRWASAWLWHSRCCWLEEVNKWTWTLTCSWEILKSLGCS